MCRTDLGTGGLGACCTEIPLNPQTLQWQGEGNQFDIAGPSWIVPAGKGRPTPHTGIVDREGWSRIAKERAPLFGEIQFLTRPGASPEKPEPKDFAIKAEGLNKVGADPEQVGPKGVPTFPVQIVIPSAVLFA